jgi:hypothetical protein
MFLGNGVAWRSWAGELVDLEGPSNPDPSFAALLDPDVTLADWRAWPGGWGSDHPPWPFASSPVGPRQHGSYGRGGRGAVRWADAHAGARLGRVESIAPPPIPRRT